MQNCNCKTLELDSTQKMSSQLQSGFIQVQAVAHLFLPWFKVISLVQWRFIANNELGWKWNSFCDCMFVPKGGVLLDGLWKIFMHYWLIFRQYLCAFMPYGNFEYTKAVTLHWGVVGQGPATEVTHLGLNQSPVFSSVPMYSASNFILIYSLHNMDKVTYWGGDPYEIYTTEGHWHEVYTVESELILLPQVYIGSPIKFVTY